MPAIAAAATTTATTIDEKSSSSNSRSRHRQPFMPALRLILTIMPFLASVAAARRSISSAFQHRTNGRSASRRSFSSAAAQTHHATTMKFLEFDVAESAPSRQLRQIFDKESKDANADIPLLASWDAYEKSLPITQIEEGYIKLADLPFYADDKHLQATAEQLEETRDTAAWSGQYSYSISYITNGPKSGKTTSVLPAFLNSYKNKRPGYLSYYLYVPFTTNADVDGTYTFSAPTDGIDEDDPKTAIAQGAAFMYSCIEGVLQREYGQISLSAIEKNTPPKIKTIVVMEPWTEPSLTELATKKITELFDIAIPDKSKRILIHLDDYLHMSNNSDFRHGAISAIAQCDRVKCVAGDTQPMDDGIPLFRIMGDDDY